METMLRRELCKEFGKPNMQIISKVETKYAMDNLDEIVDASDIIMIARGDLGIETGVENLPLYQKIMIDKCREKGKRVIMATQMMHSMKNNIRVARAEVRMTQQELAEAVDVSRQTINAIESGKFVPSTVLALKIARTFEKQVEEIFSLEEED